LPEQVEEELEQVDEVKMEAERAVAAGRAHGGSVSAELMIGQFQALGVVAIRPAK